MPNQKKVKPYFKPYWFTTNYYRKVKKITTRRVNKEVEKNPRASVYTNNEVIADSESSVSIPDDELHIDDSPEVDEYDEIEQKYFEENLSLLDDLRNWALTHKLSLIAVSNLLKLLTTHGIGDLPIDSRTLLKTPIRIEITEMGSGKFWFNGIKHNLLAALSHIQQPESISLIINVDGMSPFKSSSLQFWPILILIDNMRHLSPMVAGIYYGEGKPPLQLYFSRFVEELNDVLHNGLSINGHKLTVKIKCFVCDTPARCFVKGTPGSNSELSSCIKCTVTGEWDKKGRHMSYPKIDCPRRTNEGFRHKIDEDHHRENTPLTDLPINMVEDFVIADSLHLFDLGIMRKCLYGWREGSYNFRTKLSKNEADELSEMLQNCNKMKPKDIQRAIRGLKFLKYWKGSEYRIFLLYLGIVVLKDFLPQEVYEHFLMLSCAIRILSCKSYSIYINIAGKLLEDYIEKYIDIYGLDSISSNVHNLCHVVDDVRKFGPLPGISSYPFENFLGHLKVLVRNGNLPLSQICRRVIELLSFYNKKQPTKQTVCVKTQILNEDHSLPMCNNVYREIHLTNDFILNYDNNNKYFLTTNEEIVSMINATYFKNKLHIYGAGLQNKYDFFISPFCSSRINIYATKGEQHSTLNGISYKCKYKEPKLYSLREIKCKMFCLQYHTEFVFLPLIHTVDLEIKYE